jgi:hypothetical protein
MRPKLYGTTIWKLDQAADLIMEQSDPGEVPVSQKLRVLVNHWEGIDEEIEEHSGPHSINRIELTTWTGKAAFLRANTDKYVIEVDDDRPEVPDIDTSRRCRVDDDMDDKLQHILEQEYPREAELDHTFDSRLNAVLEAFNEYYVLNGAGWDVPGKTLNIPTDTEEDNDTEG